MTTATLQSLAPGKTTTVCRIFEGGSLLARRDTTGEQINFFWRWRSLDEDNREPIGRYDPRAHHLKIEPTDAGYSIEAAKRRAEDMAKLHNIAKESGGTYWTVKQDVAAVAAEPVIEASDNDWSLGRLCDEYVKLQRKLGASSAEDARGLLNNHLKLPFPELAQMPASQINAKHINKAIRRLTERKNFTTARKLKAYIGSAYQKACNIDGDSSVPELFENFGINVNPVRSAAKIEKPKAAPGPRKSADSLFPLSPNELRAYWSYIQKMPGRAGLVLQLHLFSGGQRIAQLAKLRTDDIGDEFFTLYDMKGVGAIKHHAVPITPRIADLLQRIANLNGIDGRGRTIRKATREFALSSDGGAKHVHHDTMNAWAHEAVAERIPKFTLKRLRSTCETELARRDVPPEHRFRLHSHGIAGVVNASYNAYDFLKQKRAALDTWEEVITASEP